MYGVTCKWFPTLNWRNRKSQASHHSTCGTMRRADDPSPALCGREPRRPFDNLKFASRHHLFIPDLARLTSYSLSLSFSSRSIPAPRASPPHPISPADATRIAQVLSADATSVAASKSRCCSTSHTAYTGPQKPGPRLCPEGLFTVYRID